MSLLESLRMDGERKAQEKEQKKQMQFAREQNTEAIGYTEDNSYSVHQAEKADLLKWQQDFGKDIIDLKFKLLGYTEQDGNWVRAKDKNPLCNEVFIEKEYEPLMYAFLNRNAINTTLTRKEISSILTNTFLDLGRSIRWKKNEYGIDFKDFDTITRAMKNFCKMAINNAEGGWRKKVDSTMYKSLESVHKRDELEKQNGLFRLGG